jgi:glycosyltransferase involved in cell wall biosynthesis
VKDSGLKIVHINNVVYAYAAGDPTANGGAERYAWRLARALAASGWTVAVGVRDKLPSGHRATIDGVDFVGLEPGHHLPSWYRFLKSENPDWWFWQCADHWWGPAVETARLAGVRTIYSAMHDRDVHPRVALYRRPRLWPGYAWGLARTDRILVQHAEQLSALRPAWRSKAWVLPGIIPQGVSSVPHADRAPRVAWVGVLRDHKRPDLLVEIARRMPSTRFVVCGGATTYRAPDGYAERIVASLRALTNVDYLGQVDPAKTQQVIGDAALLLSTSDSEGFPSVFLEAWAAGTPVVSLTVDPDRAIRRLNLGRVSGAVGDAVRDIEELLGSPGTREQIATNAVSYVRERHSPAAAVQAVEDSVNQNRDERQHEFHATHQGLDARR